MPDEMGGVGVSTDGTPVVEVAATHSAVVAEEAQGRGWLQWEGQDLFEVQRGLHDGGLP